MHYGGYTHWAGRVDFDDGSVADIIVSGTIAYYLISLATDGMIRVLDLENPVSPVTLGSVTWSGGEPAALALSGTLLYVADGTGGLRVVDVADPAFPALLGHLVIPNAQSSDVAISGSLVFLADLDQGVHVVNVTDPNNPVMIGGVDTPGSAMGIAVAGSWVYVADGAFSGLQIINASNPNQPVITGSLVTLGTAVDVTISGFAYVSDGSYGVQIVDVSNPTSPSTVGTIPGTAQSQVSGVALKGSHAFVGAGDIVVEYDVSNAALPVFVQNIPTFGPASKLAFADGPFLFQGFDVYYISPLGKAPALGSWAGGEYVWPRHVAVSGTTACLIVDRWNEEYVDLTVIDLSNPELPQEAGHLVLFPHTFPSSNYYNIAMSGSTAFWAGGNRGLKIVDVSDIQNPLLIATVPETTVAVDVAGSMAYVASDQGGLRIFDVSDPTNPINVGNLPIACWNLMVSGSRAYLATLDGVVVVDVSNPTLPEEIGSVLLPREVWGDMVEAGSFLYVICEGQVVSVVDVSNPASPAFLTELPFDNVFDLALSGTHLYLATGQDASGLVVLDVSQPVSPHLIGNVSGYSPFVATSDSLVYFGSSGFTYTSLLVMPNQCEATTGVLPDEAMPRYLGQAYPNPAHGDMSVIPFTVPRAGTVSLRVFDLGGRQVRSLVDGPMESGTHSAMWDGRNEHGERMPSGIYFYELRAPGFKDSRKMVRIE
jgi:hypothetical protein